MRTTVLLVVCLGVVFAGIATPVAAFTPSLTVDTPEQPTAGTETAVSYALSLPDVVPLRDPTTEATLTLYVDGTPAETTTISITDGESSTGSLTHTFSTAGQHTVSLETSVTLADQTETVRTPKTTVSVQAPETSTTTTEGISFTVPESLADEVAGVRAQLPVDAPGHAFVLANDSRLSLVFTDSEPSLGKATVDARALGVTTTANGLTFEVLLSESTAFQTAGTNVSFSALTAAPSEYRNRIVSVSGTHVRTAALYDPDQQQNVQAEATVGVLAAPNSTLTTPNVTAGGRAVTLEHQQSNRSLGSALQHQLTTTSREGILTVGMEPDYWGVSDATVTGIVIEPGSPAEQFLQATDTGDRLPATEHPLLYRLDRTTRTESVQLQELRQFPDRYENQTITVESNLAFTRLSLQETAVHLTPCGSRQIPLKEACVPATADIVLEGGLAWNDGSLNSSRVLVVGATNAHQDSIATVHTGTYRISGRIVDSGHIAPGLPSESVILVTNLSRTGEIDGPIPERVADQRSSIRATLNQTTLPEITTASSNQTDGENETDGSTSPLDEFAGSDDVISTTELQSIITEWALGRVETSTLQTGISAWALQTPV